MKQLKDFSKIFIFILIMYFPLLWWSMKSDNQRRFDMMELADNAKFVEAESRVREKLHLGDMLEACQVLDAERTAGNITSFIVTDKTNSCYHPVNLTSLEAFPPGLPLEKRVVFAQKNLSYKGSLISQTFIKHQTNQFTWIISTIPTEKQTLITQLKTDPEMRKAFFKDIMILFYIFVTFIVCGILIFTKSIKNQFAKTKADPWWLVALNKAFGWLQLDDLKILSGATGSLINKNIQLEKDIDLLKTSLESSVLNEIQQNHLQIPYTFIGTVAKVDINGFSKVVSSGAGQQTGQLTFQLEEFGCELLKRYKGLFEKTIGDEIVVVFKGEHTALRALAFSRDLMTQFSQTPFLISGKENFFTLKASISSSEQTFSKRRAGYGFTGDALTLTTRLLDVVSDKTVNNLSILKNESPDIESLVHLPTKTVQHQFKNMAIEECYLIQKFKTVSDVYFSDNDSHLISFYKSDADLVFCLNQVVTESDESKVKSLLQHLLSVQVEDTSLELASSWTLSFKTALNQKTFSTTSDEYKYLAQLLMASIHVVSLNHWTPDMTNLVLSIPKKLNGRLNSSLIEVLIHFDFAAASKLKDYEFIMVTEDKSFRTEANLLVLQAMKKLDNTVLDKLIEMIKAPSALKSRSGIFAAGQVIMFYKTKNPSELNLHSSYVKLNDLLLRIKKSDKVHLSDRLKNHLEDVFN